MPKRHDVPRCPEVPAAAQSGRVSREYRIELITPMFGGGVETGIADTEHPIRETAIRGHLRHWWRLIRGHSHGANMWQREEEIFGSTGFPSPVTVQVLDRPTIQLVDPTYGDRFGPIAYALFSAVENNQQVVKEGFSFRVRVSWDDAETLKRRRRAQNVARRRNRQVPLPEDIGDISTEIESALRAWLAYGGIGARTRRGCGAVHCKDLTSTPPTILGEIFAGPSAGNALDAWKAAVAVYQEFRQTPRGKKHSKTIQTKNGPKSIQVPGRSHWPEADSIRNVTGCSLKPRHGQSPRDVPADEDTADHSKPVVPAQTLPSFPKAVLGLPINFHFADGPGKNHPGMPNKDPQDVQLVPLLKNASGACEEADRLASPVITRPLWRDGKWYPAVIILNPHLPNGFQVRLEGKKAQAGGIDFSRDFPFTQVVDPKLAVLRPMRGKSSALDALAEFLTTEKHFKEVTP